MPRDSTPSLPPAPDPDPIGRKLRPPKPSASTTAPRPAGSRKNDLLGLNFNAPRFDSWEAGGRNRYTPFWTPTTNISSRGTASFTFSIEKGESATARYATEHIYEIQLIPAFFEYMDLQIKSYLARTPALQAFSASYGKNSATAFWNTILKTKGEGWTNLATWRNLPGEALFSGCLAGGNPQKDTELMYLEEKVNGLKGTFFTLGEISVPIADPGFRGSQNQQAEEILTKMANATMVAKYLDDTEVAKVFTDTSERVLERVKELQEALFKSNKGSFKQLSKLDWLGSYVVWEQDTLDTIKKNMLALKALSFNEADKWLEYAIETQRQQGKGQGTVTVAPMVALKGIIAKEKDALCPDALFNLTQLRKPHEVKAITIFPPGWLEPPPLPKHSMAGPSAAIVPTIAPNPSASARGAPISARGERAAARGGSTLLQNLAAPVARNLAAPVAQSVVAPAARALAPTVVSTLGPPVLQAGANLAFRGAVSSMSRPSGSQ